MSEDIEGDENRVSFEGGGSEKPIVPEGVLNFDHVYESLGHPRRRYLCYTLLEGSTWTLDDLATKIAAWEADVRKDAVPDDAVRDVYISLYHAHVPKLVDRDVVRYDEDDETIERGPNATQVLQALHGMGASLDISQETHARSEIDESRE